MYSIQNPISFRENIRKKLKDVLCKYIYEDFLQTLSKLQRDLDENPSDETKNGSEMVSPPSIDEMDIMMQKEEHADIRKTIEKYTLIATNLEKGIYNFTIKDATIRNVIKKWENTKFCQIYMDRLRSIYLNLKKTEFLRRIQTMEIKPSEYISMTHQDIQPELWKDLIEKKNKIEESMLSVSVKANTDLYTCKKCKSRNIYFTETQTRSADEQSTITLLCLACGKRWTHG